MRDHFDLCVIGGGPAGYNAGIRAGQLGLKVAIVERENLGGIYAKLHDLATADCAKTRASLQSGHSEQSHVRDFLKTELRAMRFTGAAAGV